MSERTFLWSGHRHLVSSSNWVSSKSYSSGIFQMTGSGWEHAHLVFVAYCSSDAHMGDTAEDTGNLGTIQVAASPGLGYDDLCARST